MQVDPPNSMQLNTQSAVLCFISLSISWSHPLFSSPALYGEPFSLFLLIYPSRVPDKPPGMLFPWFVVFAVAGGLEYASEVWPGSLGRERNDGKGLDENQRERMKFKYLPCAQQCRRLICLKIASFVLFF